MNPTLCPFCNAHLPPLPAAPTSDKLPCPRCGESVPAARWTIDPAAQSIRAGEPPVVTAPRRSAGNRTTALIVLGIMFTMALVSLSYALWTTKLRQSRHPWMPKKEEPIARRRPLELAGLGYLPKGAQLVAGLHVAEMIDDKAVGAKLLAEPRPALLEWVLLQIPRATGLTLDDIDHLLIAAAPNPELSQLVMVVQTRSAYDLEKISKSLRPAKTPLYQDKALYEYSLNPLGEALVWCVGERTLIFVLRIDPPRLEHLAGLSVKPKPVEEALPAPLRETLAERLPTHHFLWAVGQLDQPGSLKDWLPLLLGAKADVTLVKEMKTVALGVEPVEGLTLTGHFQTSDAKSAGKLKALLDNVKIDGAKSQKVEATPIDAPDAWVTWQVRGDVAVFREMMNRGKQRKK